MANEFDTYKKGSSPDQGGIAPSGIGGITTTAVSGGPYQDEANNYYLAAGTGGTADDVAIINTALPYKCYITSVKFVPLVGAASATVTLYTAPAGGGTQVSAALNAVTPGAVTTSATLPAVPLAANTSLYVRRSNNTVAGVVQLAFLPTV